MTCPVCNQSVKVVGHTTKHYEGRERLLALRECLEIINRDEFGFAASWIREVIRTEFGEEALK